MDGNALLLFNQTRLGKKNRYLPTSRVTTYIILLLVTNVFVLLLLIKILHHRFLFLLVLSGLHLLSLLPLMLHLLLLLLHMAHLLLIHCRVVFLLHSFMLHTHFHFVLLLVSIMTLI